MRSQQFDSKIEVNITRISSGFINVLYRKLYVTLYVMLIISHICCIEKQYMENF